jgi:hypothetical protein
MNSREKWIPEKKWIEIPEKMNEIREKWMKFIGWEVPGGLRLTQTGPRVDMAKSRKNVTSVCPAGFSGGLHRVLLKTGKTELSLCTYVRFRSPSLFEFQAIDGRRRDFRWTKAKAKSTDVLLFAMLLATGSCNWRQEDGNEGLHLAQRPFLYFGDWLHIGVRKG